MLWRVTGDSNTVYLFGSIHLGEADFYPLNDPIEKAFAKLTAPVDLIAVKRNDLHPAADNLVIKEMPYQVGEHLHFLTGLATKPIIFLVRDPRINIASRIKNKLIGGEPAAYPLRESGWHLLQQQIIACRQRGVPFCIIESKDFRNHPEIYLPALFERLNLPFAKKMLSWRKSPSLALDNLDGPHTHLYKKILSSDRLMPDTESPASLDRFLLDNGFRAHVEECLQIYREIKLSPELVRNGFPST